MIAFRCLLPALLLLSFQALGQSGASLLRTAMEKSGKWDGVQSLQYQTTGLNYNKWQNYSFQKPVPTRDEAFRAFDLAEKLYYMKTIGRYGGGYVFEFANLGMDTTRYLYDVSGSRNGRELLKGGRRAFDAGLLQLNETFPFYALRSLLLSGDSLQWQTPYSARHYLRDGSYEDLLFTADGMLSTLTRVQNGQLTVKVFSDYREQDGLRYPKTVTLLVNKEKARVDAVQSLSVNGAFNKTWLELPAGYSVATATPAAMEVSEIAKDVFLIGNVSGGRNVVFVRMDDHIVVTEAPVSSEVSQSIIDLIHQTIPGVPIRYVHLSHFHNDHSNGMRAFVAEGAALLATPATIAAVRTIVEDSTGRFTDALSRNKKAARYIPFEKQYLLKDGHHTILLYELKNGHAEGMSFFYLPKEKIIYQGDLYSLPPDGTVTPAIEITRDFARFISRHHLAVDRIIGHHGHANITPGILQKALAGSPKK